MEKVPTAEVKRRTKKLTDLFLSYEPYSGREGQQFKVLVTEVSHDNLHYVGHNKAYEQVCTIIFIFFNRIILSHLNENIGLDDAFV
jgi:hypothetical protein